VRGKRRGARTDSRVERRTVNSYVGERHCGPNGGAGDRDRGPRKLGKIDMRLRNASAAHTDSDRVSTGLARVGLPGRIIVIACVTVMVPISCCWVIVRGRPVVVIRVIVPDVLVDVQRRRQGRRQDQDLNKREYYEPAHGSSVLRPAGHLRKARRLGALGEWTGYAGVEISTIHISIREQRPSPPRLPGIGERERQRQGERHVPLSAPTPQVWRSMCARELYALALITPPLPPARSGGC
jgi:hypothetical protein